MNRKMGGLCLLILFCLAGFAPISLAEDRLDMTPINFEEPSGIDEWDKNMAADSHPLGSSLSSAFQMLLALGCVVTLAYLVLHKGLGSLLKRQRSGDLIKVKERINLDAKHSLFLVDVNGHLILLSASEGRVGVVLPSVTSSEALTKENERLSFAAVQSSAASGA